MKAAGLLLGVCAIAFLGAGAARVDPNLPSFRPSDASVPEGARYVAPDGAIVIQGYNDMKAMFLQLDELFIRAHPQFRFALRLKGTACAAPALTYGVSAFAPMGSEFTLIEKVAYRSVVGCDPLLFRVAHCSLDPRALSGPLGIFVHPSNPLGRLTMSEVARVLSTGAPDGDVKTWGQLGLTGEWSSRPVRTCGISEEAAVGGVITLIRDRMGGRPFPPGFQGFGHSVDVFRHIAADPLSLGYAAANVRTAGVKFVPVTERTGGYCAALTPGDITAGRYPLDRYLYIFVRRIPGEAPDPFVNEYLRLVFSREGQQAIADAYPSYLPLSASEAGEELAKLQ